MNNVDEFTMVKAVVRSLLISHPNQCMTIHQLQAEFQEHEGAMIPFVKFGFKNLQQLVVAMPDVVKIVHENDQTVLTAVNNGSVDHVARLVSMSKCPKRRGRKLRVNMKQNVRQFNVQQQINDIRSRPHVMWQNYSNTMEQPSTAHYYQQQTIVRQPSPEAQQPKQKPEHSNTPIKEALPDTTTISPARITYDPRAESASESCEHVDDKKEWSKHHSVWYWINVLNVPDSAMTLSNIIPTLAISHFITSKRNFNVRILNVFNPNRIWLRSIEQDLTVKRLNHELNGYYSHIAQEKWSLEASNVQYGLYCAALWNNEWQRAKIVGPLLGHNLKVHFIDLGVVEFVEIRHVKFLDKIFSSIPILTARASLAYLRPRNNTWNRRASDALSNLVGYEQHLMAYIVDIDQKRNVLNVVLRNTHGECINKMLSWEANGDWTGQNYVLEELDFYRARRLNFSEKFPTFACIENGHFPTIGELKNSLAKCFDFEEFHSRIPHWRSNHIIRQISHLTNETIAKLINSNEQTLETLIEEPTDSTSSDIIQHPEERKDEGCQTSLPL